MTPARLLLLSPTYWHTSATLGFGTAICLVQRFGLGEFVIPFFLMIGSLAPSLPITDAKLMHNCHWGVSCPHNFRQCKKKKIEIRMRKGVSQNSQHSTSSASRHPPLPIPPHHFYIRGWRSTRLIASCKFACFYLFSARVPEASRAVSAITVHLKFLLIRARIGFDRGEAKLCSTRVGYVCRPTKTSRRLSEQRLGGERYNLA